MSNGKNLVIVESLQSENDREISGSDFQVESSYGHIADLPSKE
jgi:DNA topoisomerase-1